MRNALICVCLAVLTFATYWKVHDFEFVNYDDENYVYENPRVLKGITWENVAYAFGSTDEFNYHPLTWISYELDVSLFGPQPGCFHLENVFIHAMNTVFLFLFLARATGEVKPATFCAALFAVHPIHVESVAWIAERKDVLSGLFFMLALLAYLSYVRATTGATRCWFYLTTLLLFVLGLLSKPTVVTFPFVLLLMDYWPLRRAAPALPRDGRSASWRWLAIEKLPMLLCSVAASTATYVAQRAGGAIADGPALPLLERVCNAAVSYCRYIGKFFWPIDLSVFYPRIKDIPTESVVLCAAAIAVVTALAFRAGKRAPFFTVGWLLFVGMLVPMLGFVQVGGQSMADRYLYLPMIGLTIILAWGAKAVLDALGGASWMRWLAKTAAAALLLLATAMTVNQVRYWHDTRSLFEHALQVTTQNAFANMQLGYLDSRLGNVADAQRYYEEAVRIEPGDFVLEFDLANLLLNNHQPGLAVAHYQKASENRAEVTSLRVAKLENNWAIALLELQQPGEALDHFRAAEKSDPDFADAHFNLGMLFLRASQLNAAEVELQKTLQLVPHHPGALRGLEAIRAARSSAAPLERPEDDQRHDIAADVEVAYAIEGGWE